MKTRKSKRSKKNDLNADLNDSLLPYFSYEITVVILENLLKPDLFAFRRVSKEWKELCEFLLGVILHDPKGYLNVIYDKKEFFTLCQYECYCDYVTEEKDFSFPRLIKQKYDGVNDKRFIDFVSAYGLAPSINHRLTLKFYSRSKVPKWTLFWTFEEYLEYQNELDILMTGTNYEGVIVLNKETGNKGAKKMTEKYIQIRTYLRNPDKYKNTAIGLRVTQDCVDKKHTSVCKKIKKSTKLIPLEFVHKYSEALTRAYPVRSGDIEIFNAFWSYTNRKQFSYYQTCGFNFRDFTFRPE